MSRSVAASFRGQDLALDLLDPDSEPLIRLFSRAGGEWKPPKPEYRNLRVDPPGGHKRSFAVLYLGNTLPTVAIECGILHADHADRYTWSTDRAKRYRVARYAFSRPGLFVPIDGPNRSILGLDGRQRPFGGYEPYQSVALELFERYGKVVHGLSWESFHRNQPGRVYALWHHHKRTIGLRLVDPTPPTSDPRFSRLVDDREWSAFLAANPQVEALDPPP